MVLSLYKVQNRHHYGLFRDPCIDDTGKKKKKKQGNTQQKIQGSDYFWVEREGDHLQMKSMEMKRPRGGLVFDMDREDTGIRCTVLSNYIYMFYTVFHFSCIAQ